MSSNEISARELYDTILQRLERVEANELLTITREVVLRGAVSPGDEETVEKKSQLVRPMEPNEALAVALELLLSASQIPLMLKAAIETFECREIIWLPDGPPVLPKAIEPQPSPKEAMRLFGEETLPVEDEPEREGLKTL